MAEIDRPGVNYWLKSELLKITELWDSANFWLGGKSQSRHSEHSPGEWIWPHANQSVQWFDWAEGEPNSYGPGGEYCMTMEELHDPFWPTARDMVG